jgi:hypothetical protein
MSPEAMPLATGFGDGRGVPNKPKPTWQYRHFAFWKPQILRINIEKTLDL